MTKLQLALMPLIAFIAAIAYNHLSGNEKAPFLVVVTLFVSFAVAGSYALEAAQNKAERTFFLRLASLAALPSVIAAVGFAAGRWAGADMRWLFGFN